MSSALTVRSPAAPPCVIYGAGPAALGLAIELAERGADVTVRAPDPRAAWRASYGAFHTMLPDQYHAAALRRYDTALIVERDGQTTRLPVPYLRLGTALLQEMLVERAERSGVAFEVGLLDGEHIDPTEITIDATGPAVRSAASARQTIPRLRYQTAFGIWAQVRGLALAPDQMLLLDFSGPEQPGAPSFLYALAEDEERVFLQETVLAADLPASFEVLRERLFSRLQAAGIRVETELGVERCLIPMGASLVDPGHGSVVCFGARAGMTQPASGYQLARTLRLAPRVAEALLAPGSARQRAARARGVTWPMSARALWAVQDRGAAVLASMTQNEISTFMSGFARQDPARFVRFVDGCSPLFEIARAMSQTYRACPPAVRRKLWGVLSGR